MTPCDISLLIALLVTLAGCGGAVQAAPLPPPPHRAAELVNFQRNGGLAATLDTVSVRTDGTTRADKRYGGAGRRFDDFRLSTAVMARLRAALARLPAAPRRRHAGAGPPWRGDLLLRYRGDYRGRARRPARGRRDLGAIAEGGGRGGPVHTSPRRPRERPRRQPPGRPRARRRRPHARGGRHGAVERGGPHRAARPSDGASIDALRRVLGLSHSGGVRIVKRLEAEGLVAREPDPADRRAVRLHLTRRAARGASGCSRRARRR